MSELRNTILKIVEDFKFDESDYNAVSPWIIVDQIINLVEQSQWVKVSDRLPENESILCVIYARDDHEFGWWHEGTGCWDSPDIGWIEKDEVTWWYPITNPPA